MTQMIDVPPDRLLYTVDEASRLLAIKRTTMFALLKDGTLPSIKIGAARRIHRDAIVAFAEKGTM